MILIKCCALCRYYKDERCMCIDSYNVGVTPDDWCPEWKEREDSDEVGNIGTDYPSDI